MSLLIILSITLTSIIMMIQPSKTMNKLMIPMILSSPLILTIMNSVKSLNMTQPKWAEVSFTELPININLDMQSITFSLVALFITTNIITFSCYYMEKDKDKKTFKTMLVIFLMFMLILLTANNMVQIFIGWEGVGIMSFLLISWWTTRNLANAAAMQAIIYNRTGDMGLIVAAALMINSSPSVNFQHMTLHDSNSVILAMGLLLAAAGKSAQLGMHPWLPAAMEGPTPVSALLHSSTMVVAGVYLMMRMAPLLTKIHFLPNLALLGACTALFASTTALYQNDIKKVIAYSTTSQLGLMMFSIGVGQPLLALYHMMTHGFFKALLFMCAGSAIHNNKDDQDTRTSNNMKMESPISTACMMTGSLALMGTPFLAGFYSKDLIIEFASKSSTNTLSLTMIIAATALTAAYSTRLIKAITENTANNTPTKMKDEPTNLLIPLIALSTGAMMSGWAMINFMAENTQEEQPLPSSLKIMTLTISLIAMNMVMNFDTKNTSTFLNTAWFFNALNHTTKTKTLMKNMLKGPMMTGDQGWLETNGPTGITKSLNLTSHKMTTKTTKMKTHMKILMLSMTILLIMM
uniref:NADH-ubiquinone oxidoreductase chain 5 n=1 Tax=Xenoturbella monstrosa TaxID=1755483 RepID=A0A0U2W0P5_9BILA|nr:NADH dehydrogenase subunit 5 [Xenoturbella monstrosa]ALS20074.1 NADH dehydrogenase subunit 5 [Xenoturbella monstrosa]